jgi:hypothetical protein
VLFKKVAEFCDSGLVKFLGVIKDDQIVFELNFQALLYINVVFVLSLARKIKNLKFTNNENYM